MNEHEHLWSDWYRPIFYRDSLGCLLDDVGMARLGCTNEPTSGEGWARACLTCNTEELS